MANRQNRYKILAEMQKQETQNRIGTTPSPVNPVMGQDPNFSSGNLMGNPAGNPAGNPIPTGMAVNPIGNPAGNPGMGIPSVGNPGNIGNLIGGPAGTMGHVSPVGTSGVVQPRIVGAPQQPQQQPQTQTKKLPNPTKGYGDKAQRRITELFVQKYETSSGQPYPRAGSEYIVDDAWNCSPKFMRPTMFHLPTTSEIKKTVGIPLGLVISPLAEQHPEEQGIPLIDHGPDGPIRCSRCRAYINPYVVWNQSGSGYTCQFCGQNNEVPLSYACPMVGNQRQDIYQRPELFKGTVEFVATDIYKTRPPTVPIYLFVVDSSFASLQNGLLHAFCSAMQRILPAVFADSEIPIGFITYDERVSVYVIDPALSKPRIIVMPDIAKPFCPATAKSVLQPYSKSQSNIDALFEIIPQMASTTSSTVGSACLGAALQVAMKTLSAVNSIGKIFLFASGMPEIGVGKIAKRFQNPESDKEKLLFAPQIPFYTEMGSVCVKAGVSVDLFLGSSAYADLSTIGETTRMTGGQFYYYPSFNIHNHGEQLFRELYRNVARESGYDGLLKVRTSSGINQDFESGHFLKSSETDIAVTHISCDTAMYVEFQIDEKLKENDQALFQCAYLYTNKQGKRIIRIHNLRLYATAGIQKIFKGADLDAILNALTRKAIVKIPQDTVKASRTQILQQAADILAAYRLHCVAKSTNLGQLVLPEALRFLPVYVLGLLKSPLFGQLKPGSLYPVLHDARAFLISIYKSMNLKDLPTLIYPLMYKIHSLVEHPLFGTLDQYGNVFFPGMARPSNRSLLPKSVLLIDTVDKLFLWIGSEVNPEIVEDLLSPEENAPEVFNLLIPLSKKETDLSERLFAILSSRQLQRMMSPEIFIVRQGSSMETHLLPYLVEDVHNPAREPKDMDYGDFLRNLHNMITTKNKV